MTSTLPLQSSQPSLTSYRTLATRYGGWCIPREQIGQHIRVLFVDGESAWYSHVEVDELLPPTMPESTQAQLVEWAETIEFKLFGRLPQVTGRPDPSSSFTRSR